MYTSDSETLNNREAGICLIPLPESPRQGGPKVDMATPQPKYAFYFALALMIAGGLLLLSTSHWASTYFITDTGRQEIAARVLAGLGEAALIAAVLAITVDRFIKERLVREITADTAKYLIGFQLPIEIQDSIRDLMRTDLIFRSVIINYDLLSCEDDPDHLILRQTVSHELTNMYHARRMFRQRIMFEESVHATVLEMKGCSISDDGSEKPLYNFQGADLEKKIDPSTKTVEWRATRHKMRPYKDGGRYLFAVTYEHKVRLEDHDVFAFADAAIGVTITANVPPGFCFSSNQATLHVGTRWEYHRVFLPGQHITVRWFKQDASTQSISPVESKRS